MRLQTQVAPEIQKRLFIMTTEPKEARKVAISM